MTIAKRAVTLTSGTAQKVYDELPLVCQTVSVTGDGFVAGEGATYEVTGSQTAVGASQNAFTYTLNDGTLADNYAITQVLGTLTVLPNKKKVTIGKTLTETIPPSGDLEIDYGDMLTVQLAEPIVCNGSTQYVCTGWTASNAQPSAGAGSVATFKVVGDVDLNWLWQTNVLTLAEAMNASDMEVQIGGAVDWSPMWSADAPDGVHCARIGAIANKTNAWMQTTVDGSGEIAFAWKCSLASRNTKVQFFVDDVAQGVISEQTDWTVLRTMVFGEGTHVIKWRLFTGRSGASEADFAAIDGLVWTPAVPPTLAEALNTNLIWRTDGAATWHGVAKDSLLDTREAWAAVSGLANCETAAVWTKVYGSGVLSFDWAISCEEEYDWFEVTVDDEVCTYITGETDWQTTGLQITGEGWHVVRWEYIKDEEDEEDLVGENTAWLDNVVWTSTTVPDEPDVPDEPATDPIPDLGETPTESQIQKALDGSADMRITSNVTNGVTYNAYREWANKVELPSGGKAGAQVVKDSSNAWLSFALDSATLIEIPPQEDDVVIESFAPTSSQGLFDFTVSVKDVEIGSAASVENLKTVFEFEGGASLDPADMSGENVSITFGTPVNGKLRFTAGPKDTNERTFFMRMKMNP